MESKSDFIRRHPYLSAQELAAQAVSKGIVVSTNSIRSVRAHDRKKGRKKSRGPLGIKPLGIDGHKKRTADARAAKAKQLNDVLRVKQQAFRKLIVELGVAESRRLLTETEILLQRIIG